MMLRLLVCAMLAWWVAGCTNTAVVSSSAGPTIQEVRQQPAWGDRPRIAVTAFDYKAARGSREVGEGMADMLSDALFNSNRFIVLERTHLDEVKAEQDLARSGRFREDTVAPRGELEGAEFIIRGAVTAFEERCRGGSVLLFGARQSCVTIQLRIVDARTGRVVNSTTVDGTSGSGGVGLMFATGSVPVGLGAWRRTPMEQAIRQCIDAAVHHIIDTGL